MTSLMTSCDLPTAPLRGAILLVHSYPILRAGWDQGGTDYQSLTLGPLISLKGDMGELQATRNITLKQTRERWLIRRRVTGYNQDNYYQHFLLSNNAEIFPDKNIWPGKWDGTFCFPESDRRITKLKVVTNPEEFSLDLFVYRLFEERLWSIYCSVVSRHLTPGRRLRLWSPPVSDSNCLALPLPHSRNLQSSASPCQGQDQRLDPAWWDWGFLLVAALLVRPPPPDILTARVCALICVSPSLSAACITVSSASQQHFHRHPPSLHLPHFV